MSLPEYNTAHAILEVEFSYIYLSGFLGVIMKPSANFPFNSLSDRTAILSSGNMETDRKF
jgi:hypothetical protein